MTLRARQLIVLGAVSAGAAACGFDARSMPDAQLADACVSFATAIDTCGLAVTAEVTFGGSLRYNTDSFVLSDLEGNNSSMPAHQVISGADAEIDVWVLPAFTLPSGSTLRVEGSRPFAIIAFGDVTIGGTIDAAAGAGGRLADACAASGGANGAPDSGGAPGGGGGGFGGAGGQGGAANLDGLQLDGGAGGQVALHPRSPLGGCPGGAGGDGLESGGKPGRAGGAVYIASMTSISIVAGAVINVGGGGGGGGSPVGDAGGGGGGSGGMIMIEGPVVGIGGVLAANGGGAGGGSTSGSDPGGTGTTGLPSELPATGGIGASGATAGGAGGAGGIAAGATPTMLLNGGGGGGGGGVGYITVLRAAPLVTGTISPPLTDWPY
ncbi:MAG: hypothetical protein AB7P03_30970 [Kofleriaceae bacterium]